MGVCKNEHIPYECDYEISIRRRREEKRRESILILAIPVLNKDHLAKNKVILVQEMRVCFHLDSLFSSFFFPCVEFMTEMGFRFVK